MLFILFILLFSSFLHAAEVPKVLVGLTLNNVPKPKNTTTMPSSDHHRIYNAIREMTNTTQTSPATHTQNVHTQTTLLDQQEILSQQREVIGKMPSFVITENSSHNVIDTEFLDPQDTIYKDFEIKQLEGDLLSLQRKLYEIETKTKSGLNRFLPMRYEKKQIATLKRMVEQKATQLLDKIRRRSLGTAEDAFNQLKGEYEIAQSITYGSTPSRVTKKHVEAGKKLLENRQDYKEKIQLLRYLKEHQEILQENDKSSVQKAVSDPQTIYDFKLTLPTDSNFFYQKITANPTTDFHTYIHQVEQAIATLKHGGEWTAETAELLLKGFVGGAAEHLVHTVKHPIEYVQNFVETNKKLLQLIIDLIPPMSDEFSMEPERLKWYENELNRKTALMAQIYDDICKTIPQISREEWGRIAGQLFADCGMLKGVGTSLKLAKNATETAILKENPLYAKVQYSLEQALLKHPEMVTAEGVTIKGSSALEETRILRNTNEKIFNSSDLPHLVTATEKLAFHKEWFDLADKLEQSLPKTKPGSVIPKDLAAYLKYEKEIEITYDLIRKTDDIALIAKNTGLPEKMIARIKNHIFYEQHVLDNGVMRFPADGDMAIAWKRLQENNALACDIVLLKHELTESILIKEVNNARQAHDITDKFYNWVQSYK